MFEVFKRKRRRQFNYSGADIRRGAVDPGDPGCGLSKFIRGGEINQRKFLGTYNQKVFINGPLPAIPRRVFGIVQPYQELV